MITIDKNPAPKKEDIDFFVRNVNFQMPVGFIDFFKESNGADINKNGDFILLWPITDMLELNEDYQVNEYAPEFFLIGSDGGDTAFAIEKSTGNVYEMPFIGMSKDEAIFITNTFSDFLGISN
ncbi:SMI1/KNR4 family protein [Mucilaginibacter sp. SMC90]|uniref:SMI1/KNR4 family protein n=1 Tax=Mucilaginibacter sp. SMC90 TaxID=2929803 RepID=UPI001FB3C711|nr:SMI1/KNR4 family protein [Mucilaginibacter sp. SMC90]UOE51296.1 SMI1/KNR4 family protein [Mucilaginibacter sp. SMC90]